MRLKKCIECGKLFQGKESQAKCPECVAKVRSTTIRKRTCRMCGGIFDGGPRAWYCPSCRIIREKERRKKYREHGSNRLLGSIDHCKICGKEYVVESGTQKYCKDCVEDAYRAIDREASKKWNQENGVYERTPEEKRGVKVCVICGAEIDSHLPTSTCSKECAKIAKRRVRDDADLKRGKRKSSSKIVRLDDDLKK